MPAASESSLPSLPRTWHASGIRYALVFFGAMMFVVCIAAWWGFEPHIRDRFTFLQRATIVGMGATYVFIGWLLWRCRATAEMEGLVVVNGLKRHEYAWEEVLDAHLPPGAPWATLDLADGTTRSVMGIQGSDGSRARRDVAELRALIARRQPG